MARSNKTKITKKNVPKKLVDGQLLKALEKKAIGKGRRSSNRTRVQTVLHQAPVSVPQKKTIKKTHVVVKNNVPTLKGTKTGKKATKADKKKIDKIGKGIVKGKKEKVKKVSKKGNDRLVPRDGVPQYKENPFISDAKVPDFVSSHAYYRWLIRSIRRGNLNEMREFFKSKRAMRDSTGQPFAYHHNLNATLEAYQAKDLKLTAEFFKLKHQLDSNQKNHTVYEPNLLEYKSSGRKNFHMIGRATRVVEMARGGKEGNNALLNYASSPYHYSTLTRLVEQNTPYTKLYQLSKITNGEFQEHELESQLVNAARMGHRELASALAQGAARNHMNELHRLTLKNEKLPDRILAVSVIKKGFMNKSITPIHTAAISNNPKMLEDLRAVHPNINIPDQDNWYTMHYAAVCDGSECLKFLLKNGGTVSLVTKRTQTPLHVACKAGRAENAGIIIDEMLELEKGADGELVGKPDKSMVNSRTRTGVAAIHIAVINNHVDVVETLLSKPVVLVDLPTSTTTNKATPLMLACGWGHLEVAQKLISKGALIEGKDKKKRTPLIYAMMNGQTHIAAMLLAKGANVAAADSSGNTSAHYAAAYGFLDCLQLIASVDSNVLSIENDWMLLPMSIAYLKGHYGIVTWLFDGPHKDKANINAKDNTGATLLSSLLSYADESYHKQLDSQIEYLTQRGAKSGIEDSNGQTALHHFAAMRIVLKGSGEAKDIDATRMDIKQYKKCLDMLIAAGGNVEARDNEDNTPLHYALSSGNLFLFKLMLEKVTNRKELFQKWASNQNILHQILLLPMVVYKDQTLWKGEKLLKASYDVLPILKDLYESLKDLFQMLIHERNKEGYPPIVAALKEYASLPSNKAARGSINNEFISTICELFEWVIRLDEGQITQQIVSTTTQQDVPRVSLAVLAMNIGVEDGKNSDNHLAFFKVLLKLSKEFNKLSEFFNFTNELNDSLIIVAISNGYTAVVDLILETATNNHLIEGVHNAVKKHEVLFTGKKEVNKTILMYLIEKGMSDLVPKVNAVGEFWNRVDTDGSNVWNYAARINNHKTVNLFKLIESKGVKRVSNGKKRTPLHEATLACEGSANSVLEPIAWLSTRSDVGSVDLFNRTCLHYAFGNENDFGNQAFSQSEIDPISVVSLLSSTMSPEQLNIADVNGNTVAHLAAMRNSTICLMTLIRKKCEVDIKNKDGNTPLALAVFFGRQSSTLTLIQANADVTGQIYQKAVDGKKEKEKNEWFWHEKQAEVKKDIHTTIPAQVVSKGGSWEAMVYVLIDVLGQNTDSMAQLVDAALKKSHYNLANQLLKTLEAILDGRVLVSPYDLLNTFTEVCFAELTAESIQKIVLDRICRLRGTRLTLASVSNVIETALQVGNWNTLAFLMTELGEEWLELSTSSPSSSPIRSLVIHMVESGLSVPSQEILRELVKIEGLNLNALYEFEIPRRYQNVESFEIGKLSPLSWAVLRGKCDLIRFLRQCGADLKLADEFGRTPLMYAIMSNNRNAVSAIIDDGKNVVVFPKKPVKTNGKNKGASHLLFGSTAFAVPNDDNEDNEDGDNDDDNDNGSDNDSNSAESENGSEDEETNGEESDNDDSPPPAKKRRANGFARSQKAKPAAAEKIDTGNDKRKKLVIANTDIFAQVDKRGRNPLDYLVEPFSWENTKLLADLAVANRQVIVNLLTTKQNPNPIELACQRMNRQMKKEMLKILKGTLPPRPLKEKVLTMDPVNVNVLSDVDKDCQQFMEEWAKNHDQKKAAEVPKPHASSTYQNSGELVYCDETKQYFNILLNKTDLNYGRYGFHNFYRMQLIKRRDCDLYILFTNWGRIGEGTGEFQTTPFNSLDLAKKEFKSVWKSKSGNEWVPLADFAEIPKKYRLVKSDSTPTSLSGIELPEWRKNNDEKDPVKRFIQDISDAKKLKEYAYQVSVHGTNIRQPFGRFTKENIARARVVLDKLKKNAEKIERMIASTTTLVESELLNAYMTTSDLSGEYYSLIPSGEFEFSSLTRLDRLHDIARHRQNLNRYEEIEVATRFLCGAARRPDIDRIEYIRSAIQADFRAETPDSEISQQILQWVHNSSIKGSRANVKMILEVNPKQATDKFMPFLKDENQKYLFHGTRATNLMSILRNGFLVDPPTACRNGNLFGAGIYLSDSFEKSSHYCEDSSDGVKYMMICQTALGGVRQVTEIPRCYGGDSSSKPEMWEDTLHYVGNNYPDGSLTYNGIAMPLLPLTKRPETPNTNYSFSLDYSEYIVRNSERVLPRYIIVYKSN